MVLQELSIPALIIGIGAAAMSYFSDLLLTTIGMILFLGGNLSALRFCLNKNFSALYSQSYTFFIITVVAFLPWGIVKGPTHPLAEELGVALIQTFGEPPIFGLGAGLAWSFLVMVVAMAYRSIKGSITDNGRPPTLRISND